MKEIREYEDLCDEVQALYEEDLRLLKEVELLEIKQDQERYLRLITQAILNSKANAFDKDRQVGLMRDPGSPKRRLDEP